MNSGTYLFQLTNDIHVDIFKIKNTLFINIFVRLAEFLKINVFMYFTFLHCKSDVRHVLDNKICRSETTISCKYSFFIMCSSGKKWAT